jgi:hypothetical protein
MTSVIKKKLRAQNYFSLISLFLAFVLLISISNCKSTSETIKEKYIGNVGDIQYDPKLDSREFKPCNDSIVPMYMNGNFYEGEKIALIKELTQNFDASILTSKNDGYITLRFVVNCNKEVGMIRTEAFDFNYKPQKVEEEILLKLKTALLSLKNWIQLKDKNGNTHDYFQYVTIKITNGKIETILP